MKLKYDVDECQERGMTYAVPLKVTIRLVVWNKDPETGVKTIRDIKEQEVYFGDIPLMGDHGTSPKRSEEHTSELQSLRHLVCRLLLEKKNNEPTRSTPRPHT